MRKQEAESSFEVRGMSEEFRGKSEEYGARREEVRGKRLEVRARSEEVRGKSEEVSSLFPSRSRLLALFSSLLAPSLLASSLSAAELPTGYEELADGLRFFGANWIETGYCHTARDRIECEITVDAAQTNASAAVFGTEGAGDETRAFAFYVKTDGDDAATYTFGGSVSGAWFPRGDRATLRLEPANADWEVLGGGSGSMQLRGASPAEGRTPLLIGNINSAAYQGESVPGEAGIAMTLHGLKVWYGGLELVHDYVPCRNGAGEEGLYDTVSGDFLPIKGGTEPEPPVITSITVDRERDEVRIGVETKIGVTYVLRRGETVGAVREGADSTVVDGPTVATGTAMILTDADKNRPKDQAFYIVEAK